MDGQENLVDDLQSTFDMVAANILAEVILDLLPAVTAVLRRKGLLICSGIIATQKTGVLSALGQKGFEVVDTLEQEGWVAIAARWGMGG